MKSKKFHKKLRLSKSTVSTLTGGSMQELKGGGTLAHTCGGCNTWTVCKTCGDECTVYTWVSCIPIYCW